MTLQCNGLPGILAWGSVIALFWFALCIPAPRPGKVAKIVALLVAGYWVFFYAFR